MDQHANCMWITLWVSLGVLLFWKLAIDGLAVRLLRKWGVRIPRDMIAYEDELKRRAIDSFEADLRAAQCRASLVEMIGEIPKDFDPTVLFGCQVAAAAHRALLAQAEEEGIIRAGQFRRVYGGSIQEVYDGFGTFGSPVPQVERGDLREEHGDRDSSETSTTSLSSRRKPDVPCGWKGGKLVPMKRARSAS